jgi:hypothetical protein
MLHLARTLRDRGLRLLSYPDALRQRANAQLAALRKQQIVDRLLTMPLESVRGFTRAHLRLTALEQAGVRTVADVVATPASRLRRVPGVGPQTAAEVVAAAGMLATALIRDTTVRLDPYRRDSAQTALLATLSRLRRALELTARLRPRIEALNAEIDELLAMAGRAGHPVRMLFSGRRARDSALVAAGHLRRFLFSPTTARFVGELRQRLQELETWQPGASWLWRDYQTRPASYHALLPGLDEGDSPAPQRLAPVSSARQQADRSLDSQCLRLPLPGSAS